jgi:hypothetical protein
MAKAIGLYAYNYAYIHLPLEFVDDCLIHDTHDTFAVNGPICSVLSYKKSSYSANSLRIQQNVFSRRQQEFVSVSNNYFLSAKII